MSITPAIEIHLRLKGKTWRQLAAELDTDAGYLHRVSNNLVPASPRLLDALGLERIVKTKTTYRRIPPKA